METPADDVIAKARLEKLNSMKGQMHVSEVADWGSSIKAQIVSEQMETLGYDRLPSLMEQLEKTANYHFDQYQKSQGGVHFLKDHPEFDEFIRLVRSGAIQFIVFALCAVAAFSQTTQKSSGPNSPNIVGNGNVTTPPPPPPPAAPSLPVLSTSDKIALQALEKQKQEAQQQFTNSNQSESVILREFTTAHPGYHVNPTTFIVEADASAGSAPATTNPNLHRPTHSATPPTPPAK
jgi:hypothetical protein